MKKVLIGAIAGLLACWGCTGAAFADDEADTALSYCADMQQKIDALVDYAKTTCIPAKGKTGMDFIFLSDQPVFSQEAAKKGWLIVVVAVAGDTFNKVPLKTEQLIVADQDMMKSRKAFKIPAGTARSLQKKVKAGQIGLDAMYSEIGNSMTPYSIPAQ
jgi:hypothetical protein